MSNKISVVYHQKKIIWLVRITSTLKKQKEVFPEVISVLIKTQAHSRNACRFQTLSKIRILHTLQRRKQAAGLLVRTNCRLFSLTELTGLFIASQSFISTQAALGEKGSS